MSSTMSFNPFTLLRWMFSGKTLTEIMSDFEAKRVELDNFYTRTERRLRKKQEQINVLTAQNIVHAEQMSKANMVSDNLRVLMTQAIGQPQTDPNHEAV